MVIIPERAMVLTINKAVKSIPFLLCVFHLMREIREKMTIIPEKRVDLREGEGSQGEKEKTTCPLVCSGPLVLDSNPSI